MLEKLKNNIIVSCQANNKEPLYSPEALLLMAKSAITGGAVALRAEGCLSIRLFKKFYNVPIIGLIKKDYNDSDIYITPTIEDVSKTVIAGAEIISIDATLRKRPNNENTKDLLKVIKEKYNCLAMADISTYEEGLEAEKLGFDLIGTTLSGYTPYSKQSDKADFELLEKLVKNLKTPIIMEGKINTPQEVKRAFEIGAFSVVIGSAITRPHLITKNFLV
ncbi:MAG: N-acetylmannosamine-6-phosphate 2-epimerase [Candidatus Sericytochromatia bacterium]